ncbi:MAG: histidine kinase [Helicobacteraceae bacterium CG2_30_36_10]|nr:MAG: histidine kinase [Helicobacteraceae bacterium CG2_30_36_10]
MKIKATKLIPYIIVIVPLFLVLIASFIITTFYLDKVTNYFNSAKERSMKENIEAKKNKSEIWTSQLSILFDYRYNRVQEEIKKELHSRVDIAYNTAIYIYEKYKSSERDREIKERIIDSLSSMEWSEKKNYISVRDFNANSLLFSNGSQENRNLASYSDADGRAIILEEIQTAKKSNTGFIQSRAYSNGKKEIILVKNLGLFNWYISSSIHVIQREEDLKNSLLEMLQSIPIDKVDFIGLYDGKKAIFLSSGMRETLGSDSLDLISDTLPKEPMWHEDNIDGYSYYSKYYKPLNWHIVYGFDTSIISKEEINKQENLEKLLDDELKFIVKSSAAIVFFVVILSLLLSRKINKIFNQYQEEVQASTDELVKLNESLEQRVIQEVEAHSQKQKLLIQQSKMAEMGDMLSMIAHQWRQPLNQMSYVIMNIESSYEYKELTKEYLDTKVKEANELLEFMSVTIDDFRNYFRPDKEKELVSVSDVIRTSVGLIQNSLDISDIKLELIFHGKDLTHIYKNEFIQVILNLIKNAKDALVQNKIKNPKITIVCRSHNDKLTVDICDNGGGVDENIQEKIFEPYFSTKDNKSGTGIGLYMSKMIIQEHLNGKLSVSNFKDGACFKIEI